MRIWSFPSFYPIDLPNRHWNGIFAHRQHIALRELGVEVKVVVPVIYKYPWPLDRVFPCNTDLNSRSCPEKRVMDGIEIFHPVIQDLRPNRFFRRSYQDNYIGAILDFFAKLPGQLTNEDVFYAQWIPDAGLVQQAAKKLGVTCGILAIGDDVTVMPQQNRDYREYFIETMLNADLRFAVSKSLAEQSMEIIGREIDFTIVRRGVNHDVFRPVLPEERSGIRMKWGFDPGDVLVLCVGSAIYRKGWIELLDAFQTLSAEHKNFKLVAVYAGSAEFSILDEARKRQLEDRLFDLGEVKPEQMHEMYQAADIFCLPSYWEGLSNAVAEAMSSGLPVVTTRVSGHPEIIESGHTGLLIEPRSASAIREALALLLEDPAFAARLGTNAREFICGTWGDYKLNSAKIIEALKERI